MAASETLDDEFHPDVSTTWRVVRTRPSRRIPAVMRPGDDLGSTLRRVRRRRRISQEQAARATRIPERYLQALEQNAPPEAYPAPAYRRAFLREYARFLGLELDGLVELLGPNPPPPIAPTLAVLAARPTSRVRHGRLVAILAAASLSVTLLVTTDDPRPTGTSAFVPPVPASAPATEAEKDSTGAAVPEETVPRAVPAATASEVLAEIRTVGRSWLSVQADGRLVWQGILASGTERTFRADSRLKIVVGNAASVSLALNGEELATLGGAGQVGEVLAVIQDGRLVISTSTR